MRYDALSRIEPVARDLLDRVDTTLVSHGAADDHPIWPMLRRLGATPGDAVSFFAAIDPEQLRDAGTALREQLNAYCAAPVPTRVPWTGTAGEAYAAQADALAAHLGSAHLGTGDSAGLETMCGRLIATASYVDAVADWYADARLTLAEALADVIGSAQAVTVHSSRSLAETVAASADIGAHILAAAGSAHEGGYELLRQWGPALGELPYRPPVAVAARPAAGIELRH